MSRLWDKGIDLDQRVLQYTAGDDYALDERLVEYDVRASIAHAEMLHASKLLDAADLAAIRDGLNALGAEHAAGAWTIELADEDGQTALEKRLTARIGAAGGRVHLGRSRNDQVLTALRLYLLDAAPALAAGAESVAAALDSLAAREGALALPGYTHMQQAMPSSVAAWAGGFAAELRDDALALAACSRRASRSPLGSAAGYGSPGLPLDRELTRARLGFDSVQTPVTAVQLSRGKAEAELLFQCALLMQDLGRLASDLLLFYTQEFAFVSLPAEFTTGSSIMPQKRNPDVFELVRGRTAVAHACLSEVLGIFAKLPSGYQRDLQLIKPPLFRGIDLALATAAIVTVGIDGVRFRADKIKLDPAIHAAEEANALVVREGIPFREAYRRVGDKYRK
ncbi:MAG TPA: argininosuccinate lyase [Steroidobacteraceae bacterium]|nr:argininosuccinate lyase [Steroidobacteraceae bacterium]